MAIGSAISPVHMFSICSCHSSTPLLGNHVSTIDPRAAYAARNPRQGAPLRRAHPVGRTVPLAGGTGASAVPDAWRQGQRRAARQSQCLETWRPLGTLPGGGALCARNQPHPAPLPPEPARAGGGAATGSPGCPAPRPGRDAASIGGWLGREKEKAGEQPHAPGFEPVRAGRQAGPLLGDGRSPISGGGHEKGAEPRSSAPPFHRTRIIGRTGGRRPDRRGSAGPTCPAAGAAPIPRSPSGGCPSGAYWPRHGGSRRVRRARGGLPTC